MSFLFSQAHANTQRRKEKALDTHAHSSLLHASPVDAVARGLLVGAPVGALYGASKAWWFEYPPRAGYALLARQAGLIAGIAAVYAGTNSLVAHARNKDDVWNAPYAGFASGFVYGMRCLALYGKFFADQYNENLSRTPFEKRDAHPPIFIGNPRDQYKARWEAIKEREATAAAESDE
ncbi:hypothetical protein HK100_011232 [Physocladia obscura]|uniref:Uncharacterized protein n=1 Tax=Physocladia obscura TaxID=109957 RepID=A0AAD5T2Z1_9FUNG|nr:hypothetical protein HK100_011232 [Physocladia obscura]